MWHRNVLTFKVVPFKVEGGSKHICTTFVLSRQWNHHIGVILILYFHNMASKLCNVQIVALKPFCLFDSMVANIFHSTHM